MTEGTPKASIAFQLLAKLDTKESIPGDETLEREEKKSPGDSWQSALKPFANWEIAQNEFKITVGHPTIKQT